MDNTEQDTRVISLNAKPNSSEWLQTEKPASSYIIAKKQFCKHRNIVVDEVARVLYCNSCETNIDAFDIIHGIALDERMELWNFQDLKNQVKQLRLERDELQRQVNNLKSAKNRLKKTF